MIPSGRCDTLIRVRNVPPETETAEQFTLALDKVPTIGIPDRGRGDDR